MNSSVGPTKFGHELTGRAAPFDQRVGNVVSVRQQAREKLRGDNLVVGFLIEQRTSLEQASLAIAARPAFGKNAIGGVVGESRPTSAIHSSTGASEKSFSK